VDPASKATITDISPLSSDLNFGGHKQCGDADELQLLLSDVGRA